MSLARAFTKRLQRTESKRPQISAPSLITSTNVASYNAPNVSKVRHSGVSAPFVTPRTSFERTEANTEEPTLTDGSSIEPSPVPSPVIEHNHLSCYFPGPTKPLPHGESLDVAPSVPRRAPSHSKHEHERLSRARSFRSSSGACSGPPTPDMSTTSARNSGEYSNLTSKKSFSSLNGAHPFSRELEQLSEVAEELEKGSRTAEREIDESVMLSMGLAKFCADEYIREIQPFRAETFNGEKLGPDRWASWI